MATPSEKSPGMENFLEQFFGRTTAIKSDTCTGCKQAADTFRDKLSQKEYTISGLCQACQDKTFGGDES